jgi:hypothetical protein
MKKLLWPALIGLALTVGALVPFAGATSGSTSASRTITLHLLEKSLTFSYQDNPPKAVGSPFAHVSAGDAFEFTSALVNSGGKRAGTLRAHCVFVRGGTGDSAASVCAGTFGLAGGDLEAQTVQRGSSNVTHIAIVGGTGVYEGATGSVTSVSADGNAPSRDTFHIVLP